MFPVEEAHEIPYKGEINNPMTKRGSLVFVSTRAGILYCVESSSQKIEWQVQVSETLVSPPFLGEENIYVLDLDNNLFCLTEEGEILWQRTNHYFDTLNPLDAELAKVKVQQAEVLKSELKKLEEQLDKFKKTLEAAPEDAKLLAEVKNSNEKVLASKENR